MTGSSLLIQACAERTACPWPDAACSWCIPRVICYSKGQAKPELLVQIIFFPPWICFARVDLIHSLFQNVSPSDMHRLYSLQGAFTPFISLESQNSPVT